jgi:hypothetical protein
LRQLQGEEQTDGGIEKGVARPKRAFGESARLSLTLMTRGNGYRESKNRKVLLGFGVTLKKPKSS